MKALVTGGAGFIGSNLAIELEKNGNEVVILDNFFSGNKENLEGFKGRFIEADILNFETDEKFDVIFHQAAITSPRHPNDEETYNKNVDGFKKMISLAQKSNAKLVYASSANLYGNGSTPMREDQEKDIQSAYGKSKLEMDRIASELFNKMHIVGLRYFNVFGIREKYKGQSASMVYHLIKQVKEGKRPKLFKWGEQKRDHIYIKDVMEATIKSLTTKSGIYNVGTGIATSFNELVKILNQVMEKNLEPEYFDMEYDPKTYQDNTQADTTKAEEILGFKAKWSLKEGIKDYMKYENQLL